MQKAFILLLFSCVVLATPGLAQQKGVVCNQETLTDCYEDAILLYNDKDYQPAKELFEKVITVDVGYKKAATYLVKCQNEIAKALIQEKTQAQRLAKAEKVQKQEIIPTPKEEEETRPTPATKEVNRIKTGDTLRISVQKVPELNKTVTVLPNGTFSFPLVGSVKASGKTLEELDQSITEALSNYINAPQVVIAPKEAQTELTSALPPAQ